MLELIKILTPRQLTILDNITYIRSVERQHEVSGNAIDYSTIRADAGMLY